MQVQLDIGFEQLVQLAKRLPAKQWTKLKQEVENENSRGKETSDLESFLLSAPTFSTKQLEEIAQTRRTINQWRTK